MNVGVIGAGTMGRIIVAALLARDHRVLVYDPDPAAQAAAHHAGASVLDAVREIGAQVGVAVLSLPAPPQVRAVVADLVINPARDLVIIDTSTVDPATTRDMARVAAEAGVGYLDAPILGRPASAGRWTVPVGGDPETLARVRPVLEAFAATVVHIGPPGSGHTLKLLNQMMFATINAVTAEVLATAAKLGLPPAVVVETISGSGAATVSPLFREVAGKIVAGDFAPTFPVTLLCKDTGLALEMARQGNAPALITGVVQTLNELARAQGHGHLDTAALVHVYETLFGVHVAPHPDLRMAIDELRRTGAGFVAVHAQQVVARGADSGVGRLIEAAEELRGAGIAGAALADRIAGRAAVLVAVWANIRSLHAELISDTALEEAARRRLPVSHERRVPMILNRRRDGPCPFEAAAADALAQGMALDATVARLREVGRSMAQRRVREEGAPP